MSRPASDKTQLQQLRREFKQVCAERQSWASVARSRLSDFNGLQAEVKLLKAEVAEWKARFDKLLSREAEGKP